MKLELESVGWRNINSYGHMWTEIQLNRNPLTVIEGRTGDGKSNGAGKSTFTDAIAFVFFGKPIRPNKKGNLVNRTNKKNMEVRAVFKSDGVHYEVLRGLKPEKFEIYENGVLVNQDASSRDYQKFLEEKVIRMNYTTFTQSVIVSKTLYTPFMQLSKPKRREYVEDVLRLKVFSNMSKLHAEDLKRVKAEHAEVRYSVDKLEIEFENLTESVETLERVIANSTKEKEDFLNGKIEETTIKINDLVVEYNGLKAKILEVDESAKTKYNSNSSALIKLENKLETVKASLEKLDKTDNVCSSCGHELSEDHRETHRNTFIEQIDKIEQGIKKVQDILVELEPIVKANEAIEKQNQEIKSELGGIQRLLQTVNNEKKSLVLELSNVTIDTTELDVAKEKLYNTSLFKQQKQIELDEISKRLNYCTIAATMLKDNGIKASIVEKSIPLINKLINQNLSKFGFFAKFELDSEFNEKILLRGFQEASYYDFSEGEKLRIDMAILLAWRDIAMLQNSMFCNVLFLDEITDASLDDEGIAIFTNMLTCLKDNNVFVITHKPEKLDNIARSRIVVTKVDGYSQIVN